MMGEVDIRPAEPSDAYAIAAMLKRLSEDLGEADVSAMTPEVVTSHGFGGGAAFSCIVACKASEPVGLALFFRHFSSVRGTPSVYVQDLWVAPQMRGQNLGERLLAAVVSRACREWQAGYLALTVYHDNPRARHFDHRLGFEAHENDAPMSVAGAAFQKLARLEGVDS